jgi:phosphoglycolate phosphatase
MLQADAYFFDIDGTLLITRDLVHWNALHQGMLEVYGIDTNIDGLSYHGKTDIAILRAALKRCGISDEVFEAGTKTLLSVVCREVALHKAEFKVDVCPGIPEVLAQILDGGRLLGVASGNLESVGWKKVSAARLRTFFSVGSFGDRFELRTAIFDYAVRAAQKLMGTSASVCFVGDTPDDILAARSVGARIISVSTGTFRFEDLACLNPEVCCRSCAELLVFPVPAKAA